MSHQTRVVNIKVESCDVRIDRTSKWGNPYLIKFPTTRKIVIELYENYIREKRPNLINALPELVGKTLGCWCKPLACHGDILIQLMIEKGLIDNDGFPI